MAPVTETTSKTTLNTGMGGNDEDSSDSSSDSSSSSYDMTKGPVENDSSDSDDSKAAAPRPSGHPDTRTAQELNVNSHTQRIHEFGSWFKQVD